MHVCVWVVLSFIVVSVFVFCLCCCVDDDVDGDDTYERGCVCAYMSVQVDLHQ